MAEYDVKELDITKGGNTYKIKGETYESKSAASGGTDLSLVTTGEKYTWNSKASSDTKNTAGTTNKTGTKMFIAAATEQSANPTTYSNSNVYIGTDNCLYSGGTKVLTAHQNISGKKNTQSAVSDPSASGTSLTFISGISQNAQGVISPAKKTVATMGGASSSAAGSAGLVPKPNAGQHQLFLKGDGTWDEPDGVRLYVADLDTVTNTSGSYTHTSTVTGMTSDLKAVLIECSNPEIFRDKVTVTTGSGTVTLTCADVAGTSTVKVSFAVQGNANPLNSTEYAALDARIGDLSDLTTTDKSNVVGAVNALNSNLTSIMNIALTPSVPTYSKDLNSYIYSHIFMIGAQDAKNWSNMAVQSGSTIVVLANVNEGTPDRTLQFQFTPTAAYFRMILNGTDARAWKQLA